jgi:hypothetical protein
LNSFRNFDINWPYKLTSIFINSQQKKGNYESIRGQEMFLTITELTQKEIPSETINCYFSSFATSSVIGSWNPSLLKKFWKYYLPVPFSSVISLAFKGNPGRALCFLYFIEKGLFRNAMVLIRLKVYHNRSFAKIEYTVCISQQL